MNPLDERLRYLEDSAKNLRVWQFQDSARDCLALLEMLRECRKQRDNALKAVASFDGIYAGSMSEDAALYAILEGAK